MLDKLQAVEDKYLELESLISDPDIIADMPKWQKYNQEHAALTELVDKFREYKKICKTIDEDKAMFDEDIDDDMRHMLEDEVKELSARKEVLEGEFPILLLPKDPNDSKNVIMEIRGGVGGEEAALLLVIYSECILVMQKCRAGKLKCLMQILQNLADLKKYLSVSMVMVLTVN